MVFGRAHRNFSNLPIPVAVRAYLIAKHFLPLAHLLEEDKIIASSKDEAPTIAPQ